MWKILLKWQSLFSMPYFQWLLLMNWQKSVKIMMAGIYSLLEMWYSWTSAIKISPFLVLFWLFQIVSIAFIYLTCVFFTLVNVFSLYHPCVRTHYLIIDYFSCILFSHFVTLIFVLLTMESPTTCFPIVCLLIWFFFFPFALNIFICVWVDKLLTLQLKGCWL